MYLSLEDFKCYEFFSLILIVNPVVCVPMLIMEKLLTASTILRY